MSGTTQRHVRADEELASALRDAFAEARVQGRSTLRVCFDKDVRLGSGIVELVATELNSTRLDKLILEHSSPSAGFVACAIRLRCPRVSVEVTIPGPRKRSSSVPARAVRVTRGNLERPEHEDEIDAAFDRFAETASTHCIVAFPSGALPGRGALDNMAVRLGENRRIRFLALVHASPSAGFIASALALRCPWVTVIACRSEAEARRKLTGPGLS